MTAWQLFASRVVDELREREMSQRELARKIGCTEAWLSRLLKNNRNGTMKSAQSIAEALDLQLVVTLEPGGEVVLMDSRLAELKRDPFSLEPRFYPPGGHPAIQQMKRYAAELELVRSKLVAHGVDTSTCDACLDYALGKIAAFEEAESELKQRTLLMIERRER